MKVSLVALTRVCAIIFLNILTGRRFKTMNNQWKPLLTIFSVGVRVVRRSRIAIY